MAVLIRVIDATLLTGAIFTASVSAIAADRQNFDGKWSGDLECGPSMIDNWSFAREVEVVIKGEKVTVHYFGDTSEETTIGLEPGLFSGVGDFTVSGQFTGASRILDWYLNGSVEGKKMELSGMRGSRACEGTIVQVPPEFDIEWMAQTKVQIVTKSIDAGDVKAVRNAIAGGLDVNARTASGVPLVVAAAAAGRLYILHVLVEGGADIEAIDDSGQTALVIAVRENREEVARYLIGTGANTAHKTKFGYAVRQYAKTVALKEMLNNPGAVARIIPEAPSRPAGVTPPSGLGDAAAVELARLKLEAEKKARRAEEARSARDAEIARLKRAIEAKEKLEATQRNEAARIRRETDQSWRAEVARLERELEAQRKAAPEIENADVGSVQDNSTEINAREEEIARLKQEIENRRQAEAALKTRELHDEKTRAAEITRLKREIEKREKAEAARRSRDTDEEKARANEIARLKQEIGEREKAEEARKTREAEKEKGRAAEIARLKREAEEARKAREAEFVGLKKEVEERFWQSVRHSRDLKDVQDYLKRYPQGRFVEEAHAKVALLSKFVEMAEIAFGNYHALVIGINDYKGLTKLKTAVDDAKAVAAVLEEHYGFKVTLLINPGRSAIVDALDRYRETLGGDDNLLIYYAGHGWLDEEVERGYWLPVDAQPKRRSGWISNATITDTLKGLDAKHVMVVADSCYSGTLVRGNDVGPRKRTGDYWKRMAKTWTRVAITSGGLEPVVDSVGAGNSPFAKAFMDALSDNDSIMDGTQLFSRMRRPVMIAATQTPQYADVREAGHDGGDFLFVRRK